MICVGIDVAKDKHDCVILSSEGEVLADVFAIQNNAEGSDTLLQTDLYRKGWFRPFTRHPFTHFPASSPELKAHLTHLKTLLNDVSKGRYGRDMATTLRDAARCSVGSVMPAKSLELRHTIHLIHGLDTEIEAAIQSMMEEIQSPITTIPGISVRMLVRLIYALEKNTAA